MISDDDIDKIIGSNNEESDLKLVDETISSLMSSFDTVQIFCTRQLHNSNSTVTVHKGKGNWFARYGQVQVWAKAQENLEIGRFNNEG